VRLTSRAALRIFDIADVWATRTGNTVRLVSANDHVHARHSAHYAGLAVDLHSSNLEALAKMLKKIGYRVLWKVPGHFSHVHVEEPRAAASANAEAGGVTRSPATAGRNAPRIGRARKNNADRIEKAVDRNTRPPAGQAVATSQIGAAGGDGAP
jgi:hypothetical protein